MQVEITITTSEFIQRIREARAAWNAALARYTAGEMEQPGFCGEWSLEDIIAHITWYEEEMVTMLERREFAGSELWDLPLEKRNAAVYKQVKKGSVRQKLTAAHNVHKRLIKLVFELSDKDLNDPAAFPGMPAEWKPWQVLEGNTYGHYLEHLKDIKK